MRTLYKVGQYENLQTEMTALNLDILGVAETRWNEQESRVEPSMSFLLRHAVVQFRTIHVCFVTNICHKY